ncbi:MAG TPA: outer membrane beta-barrel family protein [Chryseolinea sp.]|nr:outer membrane beta-barrel family protein [Chryseolinea sp.]
MTHNSLQLAFLLLLLNVEVLGQVSISGNVTDGKQQLPSVTVLLLMLDSTLVKGAITDQTGKFVIENVLPGDYLLSASMTGYERSVSPLIPVEGKEISLPFIQLNESVTALQAVIISAEKQLFDQQIDRLVINVGSSVTSWGNTILEVIQKSPGVVVNRQTNSISMNGKSGVRVMMNDKIVQLPLDVVVQMLDGMSASNVEKIELITAPPAKYDAEGNAGIIHIVTKGQEDVGTNGSFGLTAGARWAENLAGNFNLNHRNRSIAYFLDYSILRNHNLHIMKMERQTISNEFEQTADDYSRRENITIQQNLSAGFEWKPTRNTSLTLLVTGYRRNWDLDAYAADVYRVKADSTISTTMDIHESNIWQSAMGSIGMQTQLDTKSEISVNFDYLYYHNSNPSQYDLNVVYEQQDTDENSKIDLTKTTPIRFFIAKADYQHRFTPSFSLETGVKAVTSALDNNVLVRRGTDYPLSTDPALTSYSTLGEQVAALYVSTKWQGGKWQINTGIRYEYTHTAISTPDQKNLINRKYGFIFPNVSIKKTLDIERDMQFSYSRRITRPTYNDIAPFVFFWSPNTFSAGNTSLYPAITDAISAGYHVKQWILSLQLSHARNEITFLQPENDNANNLIYRSQNLKYLNAVGLTNSYSIVAASWWDIQCNLTAQYHVARAEHLLSAVTQRLYGVNVNVVNQFKLGNGFTAELSGMYQSKLIAGISQYLPFGSLNAGIQKKLGSKAVIRLAVDDMLNTNNWRIKTYSAENNLNSYFDYRWHNRFIRITYTYNFGNNKLHAVKPKSGSEEERGRVN